MHLFVHWIIHERVQSAFCHYGYSVEQHPPQGGQKQQQHNDTANLFSQFINKETSVTKRKRLEMKAKSYPQKEQYPSILSLPFDFKIQYNQYDLSSKKLKALPHEVTIGEDRENAHHPLLKEVKDATIPARSAFPVSMVDQILPFQPPS